MESLLPRWHIIFHPVAYYRLPRDLLSINPRPIIDYPVPYYRLPRDLLAIPQKREMPQVLLN